MSDPRSLFVYGTLMDVVGHPMHSLLADASVVVGPARWRGTLFDLGEYPGAVEGGDGWVRGEVVEILASEVSRVFGRLDEYEDCDAPGLERETDDGAEPREFRRVVVPVLLDDGREMDAWIYLLAIPTEGLPVIETGDYRAWTAGREGPESL